MTPPAGGSPGRHRLRILGGGRAGDEPELLEDRVVLGRSPDADIRLSPARDLSVSALHAELRREPEGWTVRDLGSRNGTFVNGVRIQRPARLEEGDTLRLGSDGPEARLVSVGGPPTVATGAGRSRLAPPRIAAASVLLVAVLAATLALLYRGHRDRTALEEERDRLHATVDSLLGQEERAFGELEGELRTLSEALERSRAEVERLRGEVRQSEAASGRETDEILTLRRDLDEAIQALARQQMAASLDFQRIERANRPAVVLVFVETEDGRVRSGSGFAVRDHGTLVTAGHLLGDEAEALSPRRVAVQFSDSDQVWPARVLAVSSTSDLAVLQAENISGTVPVVERVNPRPDTVQPGRPVALMGFPLGGVDPVSGAGAGARRAVVRPLLSAGVVRESTEDWLEVQGFGEAGASGSPVFDASGEVIAVVRGGERGPPGGVLVAVPSDRVLALLERVDVP